MSPDIVKDRWLGFLIWQTIFSTFVFLVFKTVLLSPFIGNTFIPSLFGLLSFLGFHFSLFLFSSALFIVSSPREDRLASASELALGFVRFFLKSVVFGSSEVSDADFRRRARKSAAVVFFVIICGLSGFVSGVVIFESLDGFDGLRPVGLGLRGAVFGLVYGAYFIYRKRWIMAFPIIQRPLFFCFKMGLRSSLKHSLRLSSSSFVLSTVLMAFLPNNLKTSRTLGQFIVQHIILFLGTSVVSFCWELSCHLLQVLYTRRSFFAPPQGSAAAETNPSEPLLAALEQSNPRSLYQYLAFLDLCMVCERNVDTWRRAAFFEETGETYRRVITVCLRPLEQLTSRLSEGLEGISGDRSDLLSKQLHSPTDTRVDPRLHEAFDDFQLYAWCSRTVSALTACSHSEDRLGVAQLTGSNASAVSTLLSCLIAVEACLGKKTSAPSQHLMGPGSIKWATVSTGRKDAPPSFMSKKKDGVLYSKAYTMADVLRTSIYEIVSVFKEEMHGAKATGLEKDWIIKSKPLYGTREILAQKLSLFLDFNAN
ncbi:hypothetical protein H6P81_018259 [Aristolochia fimbriata]|uniref:Nucleoporin protein Ndc1-Nup n=1 Tax=Aristolochia fimbriata TaxID=158543 RepID=A0AAV7E2L2_ARIFI|nr:hypothetical protein H6P81_018259 [Aristolochia fimbriata]